MKKDNAMIDFKNYKMIMFQKAVDIFHTASGHYCILLNNFIRKDEFVDRQISYFCCIRTNKSP